MPYIRRSRATTCAEVGPAGLKTLTKPSIVVATLSEPQLAAQRANDADCRTDTQQRRGRNADRKNLQRAPDQEEHAACSHNRVPDAQEFRRRKARGQKPRAGRTEYRQKNTGCYRRRHNPSAVSAASTSAIPCCSPPRHVRPDARKWPPPPSRFAAACTFTRPLERRLTRISPSIALKSAATSTPSCPRSTLTVSSVSSPSAPVCSSISSST